MALEIGEKEPRAEDIGPARHYNGVKWEDSCLSEQIRCVGGPGVLWELRLEQNVFLNKDFSWPVIRLLFCLVGEVGYASDRCRL
jgi:hypothetical protein